MSILITIKAISTIHIVHIAEHSDIAVFLALNIIIDIFYPSGADPTYPLISLQNLRYSPG